MPSAFSEEHMMVALPTVIMTHHYVIITTALFHNIDSFLSYPILSNPILSYPMRKHPSHVK